MPDFFDFFFWQSFVSELLATFIGAGLGVGCIIRAMPISDSVSCRSVIPFHADR